MISQGLVKRDNVLPAENDLALPDYHREVVSPDYRREVVSPDYRREVADEKFASQN